MTSTPTQRRGGRPVDRRCPQRQILGEIGLRNRCCQVQAAGAERSRALVVEPGGRCVGFAAVHERLAWASPAGLGAARVLTARPGGRRVLLRITFATPEGDEVLEVHPDGRRIDRPPGAEERVGALDDDRMGAIRQVLEETDWAALPERRC